MVSLESIVNAMSRALEGLGSLPWGVHAAVALAMAAGLVLWLMGQRYVRHTVVLLGAVVGALIGTAVAPAIASHGGATQAAGAGGSGAVYQGLLIGLFVGALVGLLMFRSAMALALGVVLGALLPLSAATVLHFWPLSKETGESVLRMQEDVEQRAGDERREFAESGERFVRESVGRAPVHVGMFGMAALAQLETGAEKGGAESHSGVERLPESMRAPMERVQAFTGQVIGAAKTEWEAIPNAHKAIIVVAGVVGLAAGVILGLMMPAWGAAACTAMFGAFVWLAAFVWLSNAFNAPWRTMLDRGPSFWLATWGAASLVGMGVQWSGLLQAKKKPAGKPAGAPAAA